MNSNAPADPATFLSGRERRAWRQAERRALRDQDALQLTTLRTLAATGGALTGLLYQDSGGRTAPAEFIIAGKRIRAGRVNRPALRALTQAIAATPAVPLLAASRYGPYWVLTFELPAAPLAVLADKLTILPDTPGASVADCVPLRGTSGGRRGYGWPESVPGSADSTRSRSARLGSRVQASCPPSSRLIPSAARCR